ncbi:MAG: Mur ligase family protein [Thermoguttaceae bacterium]
MRASYSGGEPVHLKSLLESVGKVKVSPPAPDDDIYTCSCCSDPFQLKRGDIFFLLDESDTQFGRSDTATVSLAQEHGCAAIVASRQVEGVTVPLFVVTKIREAFGTLCHAIYGNPARTLKLIGITGTSGKTVTSYIVAGVLAESGHRVGLVGSLGVYDGESMYPPPPSSDATPSPDLLAYWLFRMEAAGCTHAIVEVSSRALAEKTLAGIKFDAVCITNIAQDHIDYHGSVHQYRRTKLSIFSHAKKDAIAILNADDKVTSAIMPLVEHPTLTVSLKNEADLCAELVERHRSEQTFVVTAGCDAVPVRTAMIGDPHITNCLLAIGLGIAMGNDLKTSVRGLERVDSVPGRLERLECGQPFGVFVDCAATPERLATSLRTLREVTRGRLLCVMSVHDVSSHDAATFGRAVGLLVDDAILTVDPQQTAQPPEAVKSHVAEIVTAFDDGLDHQVFTDRATAIASALSTMSPDDVVLIIESGVSGTLLSGSDAISCGDKAFARQWLCDHPQRTLVQSQREA